MTPSLPWNVCSLNHREVQDKEPAGDDDSENSKVNCYPYIWVTLGELL